MFSDFKFKTDRVFVSYKAICTLLLDDIHNCHIISILRLFYSYFMVSPIASNLSFTRLSTSSDWDSEK